MKLSETFVALIIGAVLGGLLVIAVHIKWDVFFNAITADPKTAVAAAAAAFALMSGVLGPLVQLVIGSKQAVASQRSADAAHLTATSSGTKEVAKLRIQWMEKLRTTLAEYHSLLMSKDDDELTSEEKRELSKLGTELDLMLNQKEKLQKTLWKLADDVHKLTTLDERHELDQKVMSAGRDVLKAEWIKVKSELREGQIETLPSSTKGRTTV